MFKLKIISVLGVAVLLAACGEGDSTAEQEERMENEARKLGVDADVELDEDGEVKSIELQKGNTTFGQNVNLPSDFPTDIAISEDWNIMAISPVPPNGFSVQAIANDNADDILDMLRDNMTANGWSESAADDPTPQMSRIGFEKDNRMANFNIVANGNTNMVQLLTMQKP